jgi:acyl dehydratase
MLTGALISAAVALNMPGPGSIYLGQTMKFRAPVMIGDTLTVKLEVISKREGKNIAVLDCDVVNQHGKTVVKGEATALVPTEKLVIETAELPPITIG